MDWNYLAFLAEPWFVLTWYGLAIPATLWVLYDVYKVNRPLDTAMKWAWPILVFFFSLVGVVLYVKSSRPPGIGRIKDRRDQQERFKEFVQAPFSKLTGAVSHCLGGDGLGIITAMVIARVSGMNFWQEFWFEFLAGYVLSWVIFQYKAMRKMTDSTLMALWMGGRAEIFTMMTAMTGMGAVMGYVTPMVVGEQPNPDTFAFWGFAAFGLLVGYLVTYPMSWMLVRMGWKHGMG